MRSRRELRRRHGPRSVSPVLPRREQGGDVTALLLPSDGPDDVAVVSLIVDLRQAPSPTLSHGAILIGPPSLRDRSWTQWYNDHHLDPLAASAGATIREEGDTVLLLRQAVTLDEANRWVASVVDTGHTTATSNLPGIAVPVAPPQTPLRVFPHSDTPLSGLCAMACRPLWGFHLPALEPVPPFEPDRNLFPNDPILHGSPALWAVGVSGTGLDRRGLHRAGSGLLIGRLERRAWIDDVRGGDRLESFDVHIGLDPDQVALWELELELEERMGEEMIYSRRVRLDELRLPDLPATETVHAVTALPTLGYGVRRRVSLRHFDGDLLDLTSEFNIAERVETSVHVAGANETLDKARPAGSVVVGHDAPPHDVYTRQADLERVETEYRQLLQEGLADRIIEEDRDAVIARLRQDLSRSAGEVAVVDRYFANSEVGWEILRAVGGPVRLLISQQMDYAPPSDLEVSVRIWTRKPIPFHDRLFLWAGGGLSIGQSPNGFGATTFRLQRLTSVEANGWRHLFDAWWQLSAPLFPPE